MSIKKSTVTKYENGNSSLSLEQNPNSNGFQFYIFNNEFVEVTKEDLAELYKFLGEVLVEIDSNIELTVPEKRQPAPVVVAQLQSKFAAEIL